MCMHKTMNEKQIWYTARKGKQYYKTFERAFAHIKTIQMTWNLQRPTNPYQISIVSVRKKNLSFITERTKTIILYIKDILFGHLPAVQDWKYMLMLFFNVRFMSHWGCPDIHVFFFLIFSLITNSWWKRAKHVIQCFFWTVLLMINVKH